MTVDIVTPSRRLVEGLQSDSVVLPTAKGQIEILPGHDELITLLGTGEMVIGKGSGKRKFAISYGFAEVRTDHILVLAETCEEAHEIDVQRAKAAQKKAEDALSAELARGEFRKMELKLQRALVRQQAAAKS